ncbi:MAG TPA: DUF4097 family beta strand repeat-containing protein [Steroidobacteraceae bacterium]|nr:DUF4097 family beta strand repeat-containing protein [Steroidobacteraceae bacterium]
MSKHMPRIALAAIALLSGSVACAKDQEFEKRVAADPKGLVDISNVAGTVKVIGWNRPEVSVDATYEKGVERIDVTSEGKRTRIKVVLPRNSRRGGDAYLEVRVPAASELEVSTVSAEIESSGITGRQRLNSVSGNVETDLAENDVQLKTVSGDIRLRGRGKPSDVRATTVSGNITLNRGAGELDATTTSGDLIVELEPARAVRVRTVSGDLRLRGELTPDAEVDAETVSGELSARLGGKGGFDYEATSFSGDIDSCFPTQAERSSKYGPGMRLDGSHGDGKASVRMKTMSGDIELCDK